jgi:hypothetical protein
VKSCCQTVRVALKPSSFQVCAVGCVIFAGVLDCLEGVIAGLPEECKGLTVLVVDSFVLTLLDATVGLAAVIDAGFLGTVTF